MLYLLTAVEVSLQLYLEISLFLQMEGGCREEKKWRRWLGILLLGVMAFMAFYNNLWCVVSTGAVFVLFVIAGLGLCLYTGRKFSEALSWGYFYECSILLLKMPIVILTGIYREGNLVEINNNPEWQGSLLKVFLLLFLVLLYRKSGSVFCKFLSSLLQKRKWVFLLIGSVEWIFTAYLMEMSRQLFYSWTFMMNLLMLIALIMTLLIFSLWMQKASMEREKNVYLSREKLLRTDYKILRQEYEKNRKVSHDHKYEISYLYDCLTKKENEKALSYLEERKEKEQQKRKAEVWTGCGPIDFLINMERERAHEKNIRFQISIDTTGIPIEEYDFFAVMGNLLDNALEAAEKCEEGNRYVNLEMKTMNRMFMVIIKNGYAVEPIQKRGRFLSSKGEDEEHGWGIENVREIVEKKGGYLKLEYGSQVFTASVIFGV